MSTQASIEDRGTVRPPSAQSTREFSAGKAYAAKVQDHLDLPGASGAIYRFRLIEDPAQLPSTAGNFVYVRWRATTPQVMCCGAVGSLLDVRQQWDSAVRSHSAQGLYIRLNVARSTRGEEHLDLISRWRPPIPALDE